MPPKRQSFGPRSLSAVGAISSLERDWRDYLILTKPDISFLVSISTLAGFVLGSPAPVSWFKLLATILGTTLAAAGACALNHAVEADRDARMKRTASRPVAAGRLTSRQAYAFGLSAVVVSVSWLCPTVNPLTAILAAVTVVLYVYVYTPLKSRTSWNTVVGTIPGALPALGGYVAATNDLFSPVGWSLFLVLAFWQLPHFYSLAWMYRKDYGRGDFRMISVADDSGRHTALAAVVGSVALVLATAVPFLLHAASVWYLAGATLLGLWLLYKTVQFARERSAVAARTLLKASILYIPVYVALLVVDHVL